MRRHVIIGNGGAAISAIRAIRSVNDSDEIVLVSKESCLAYSPVLLAHYLSGHIPYHDIFICSEGFYRENSVTAFLGKKAVQVEPGSKSIYLDDSSAIQYDDLMIATGSSPSIPTIEGVNLPGVSTFWTAEDARRVSELSKGAKAVAVIGAGLVGLQVVDALVRQGKKVWLIEALDQVMSQVLDMEGAEMVQERLRNRGVTLCLNDTILRIQERGERKLLSLASGIEIEVDLVILATGAKPNVELLKGSGVQVSQGVLVDDYSHTTVEDIYAAGDVAETPDPITGKPEVTATWPNAIEQGWTAGLNMARKRVPRRRKVRSNVFTVLDLFCASVGLVTEENEPYSNLVQSNGNNYRKLTFKDGLLVGAVMVGEVEDAGILTHFIEHRELFPNLRTELQNDKAFVPFAKAFAHWSGLNLDR